MHRRHLLITTATTVPLALAGCTDALESGDGDGDDGPLFDESVDGSQTFHFSAESGVELRLEVEHHQGEEAIVALGPQEGDENILFETVQMDGEWEVQIEDAGEYDLRVSSDRADVLLEEI